MSIWYVILFTVLTDGKATVDVRYPNNPQYNNEKTCNEAGNYLMEQEQTKIGTNSGTVYYICKELTDQSIKEATGKSGSNG
jgi:hypothetical protein